MYSDLFLTTPSSKVEEFSALDLNFNDDSVEYMLTSSFRNLKRLKLDRFEDSTGNFETTTSVQNLFAVCSLFSEKLSSHMSSFLHFLCLWAQKPCSKRSQYNESYYKIQVRLILRQWNRLLTYKCGHPSIYQNCTF